MRGPAFFFFEREETAASSRALEVVERKSGKRKKKKRKARVFLFSSFLSFFPLSPPPSFPPPFSLPQTTNDALVPAKNNDAAASSRTRVRSVGAFRKGAIFLFSSSVVSEFRTLFAGGRARKKRFSFFLSLRAPKLSSLCSRALSLSHKVEKKIEEKEGGRERERAARRSSLPFPSERERDRRQR